MRDILKFAEGHANECCGPAAVALAAFSAVTSIAGGIQQGYAAEQQAEAQARQLEAQAASDRYNQQVAQQNVELVRGQTKAELEKADRERRLRMGASRAAGGASGIGLENFGDILQSSAEQEELNLLTIRSEGQLREREFTTQSDLLGASAAGSTQQAGMARSAGKTSKAASVINGVGSAAGTFAPYAGSL